MADPYDPNTSQEAIDAQEPNYPQWRRVDLLINATLIAKVRAPLTRSSEETEDAGKTDSRE